MKLSAQNWRDLEIVWDYLDIKHALPEKADVAIIGGSGNLTDSAEKASELYNNKIIPLIVASGFANPYFNIVKTEAELLGEVLEKNGVPKEAIIQEPNASNTAENITCSVDLLGRRGIKPSSIILIHKPYMTRRFFATAKAYLPDPQPRIYATSSNASMRYYCEYDRRVNGGDSKMLTLMLGDYERIKEYPKHGWMIWQEIPEEVENAYYRLKASGIAGKPINV